LKQGFHGRRPFHHNKAAEVGKQMLTDQTNQPSKIAIPHVEIAKPAYLTWLQTIGWWILNILLILGTLWSLAGFFGRFSWVLDGTTHFRVQCLVVLFICAVLFFLTKHIKRTLLSSLLCLLNLALIVPFYLGMPAPSREPSYRLAMANIEYVNEDVEAVQSFIRSADADILILEEFTPTWQEKLDYLKIEYPYFETSPRTDAWGIALFSRIPYESLEVRDTGPRTYPTIYAHYNLDGTPITVIGTHPAYPVGDENVRARDLQLATLVEFASQRTEPVIMCGDFNTTLWSVNFREFLADADLRNATQGCGFQPTWPSSFPLILTPFDHCLVSDEVLVHNFDTGPNTGSDHYPILIDFSIEPSQP
jgi:endonuclease/exonuclease/phosphatase (EEP) superfamily protein YafD